MKFILSQRNIVALAFIIAVTLSLGRLIKSNFDPSYFIVAGSDYVDAAKTPAPVIVQPGAGYDGQFFYRYALNPLNFDQAAYGITVDVPPYRMQRIGYPLLVWLLSLGGQPQMVPWMLILINIIAFAGIFFYTGRIISLNIGDARQGLLPLLLCGLYMSLSRDLAEVTEIFFFAAAVYYMFANRLSWFIVFATLTIFCRETSVIALLPLTACLFFREVRKNVLSAICLCIPFLLFILWKYIIHIHMPLAAATAGYTAIGIPFKGMLQGFKENMDFSTGKNTVQFLFWISYFFWTAWFMTTVLGSISFKSIFTLDNAAILKIVYLVWLAFAFSFTDLIYCDDWGFVRVFSLWSMVGIIILITSKKRTSKLFNAYSVLLVLLTIMRLVVKV